MFTAASRVFADGTETLDVPSITIESGTGIVVAGIGLAESQPNSIEIDIPAGATIKQVLLYWSGFFLSDASATNTMTITVDSNSVTGVKIGGPAFFFSSAYATTYRADITSLGLINPGTNTLQVGGLSFDGVNHGAGLLVIFDDSSGTTDIEIRDGTDTAYFAFPEPRLSTIPQTFGFDPADKVRTAYLAIFAASVEGSDLPATIRPNVIKVTVDNGTAQLFSNQLNSNDGREWDSLLLPISIPVEVSSLTVEAISDDIDATGERPASFVWICGTLAIPIPELPLAVRVTGGGLDTFDNFNGVLAKANSENNNGTNRYQFGGQAGAPTASQPQPLGEWTHHQQSGPAGSFTFHAGTASAPPGTEIDFIIASDPGWCVQARQAPAKQIDFEGVGTFKNIKNPPPILSSVVPGVTFHWFEVHIEDLGEPGKSGKQDPPADTCPPLGSAGQKADCDCPDFYKITIYKAFDPAVGPVNKTDVIYEVHGYVTGGNLQIHPQIK